MNRKEIKNKFEEYKIKQEDNEFRKRLAEKLITNSSFIDKTDDELRRSSNTTISEDIVHNKLCNLINLSLRGNYSLSLYFLDLDDRLKGRTMKENEYNYLLNNSPIKIYKDKSDELTLNSPLSSQQYTSPQLS